MQGAFHLLFKVSRIKALLVGASRFCSEKGKKLLRNHDAQKLLKNVVKLLEYFQDSMSHFNNNCFVINIKVQLRN